ncbi:hypothetical protein LZ554_007934 [Drepanopeziza brunnea f. sp. 'monogermtubi']|nr:hypothetical protein LZ554_007934 [Drepanopeziza brunnea f. sp. 'monogermtubi']
MEYFIPSNAKSSTHNFVNITFRKYEDTDPTNVDALESHFICEILGADWYDASGASIERCNIDEADKICKQVILNLQVESSSTEAFLINLSALAGGPLMTKLQMTRLKQGSNVHYQCHWKMRFGGIEGEFKIGASVWRGEDSANMVDRSRMAGEEEIRDWKKRYLDLQHRIWERDDKAVKLKNTVLDALLDSHRSTSI